MFHNPFADGIVIVVILLLFFGPKRLPMLSRSIGESIKEFKGGIGSGDSAEKSDKSEIPPAATTPPVAAPPAPAAAPPAAAAPVPEAPHAEPAPPQSPPAEAERSS